MSDNTFALEIVTPTGGVVYERRASHLSVPGEDGSFGILAHHADLMAALGIGRVHVDEEGGQATELALAQGFIQVEEGRVRILAEAAELVDRIDVERARDAEKRARERLEKHESDTDMARAELALKRAINRIALAKV